MAFDDDTAGRKAVIRAYDVLRGISDRLQSVSLSGRDPAEILETQGATTLRAVLRDRAQPLSAVIIDAHIDSWERRLRDPEGPLLAMRSTATVIAVLASPAFERVAHPSADAEGRRTPALRFGDPRVMALAGALCQTLLAATGFTNKNLRVLIAGLLGSTYTPGQMTYDLRRLRLNGLIRRLPRTNRYTLTEDGIRIAASTPRSTTGSWSRSLPRTRPGAARTPRRSISHHPPGGRLRQPGTPSPRRVKLDTNVHKLTIKDR